MAKTLQEMLRPESEEEQKARLEREAPLMRGMTHDEIGEWWKRAVKVRITWSFSSAVHDAIDAARPEGMTDGDVRAMLDRASRDD